MSGVYHLFRSYSLPVYKKLLALDIAGIAFSIAAADVLVSHFEMRCHPEVRIYYQLVILVFFAAAVFYVPWLVKYRRTNQRTIIMCTLGLLASGSILHRMLLARNSASHVKFHICMRMKCIEN